MKRNYIKHYILAKKTVNIGRKVALLKTEQRREGFAITDTHMHPLFYTTHTHPFYLNTYHVEMCYMYAMTIHNS